MDTATFAGVHRGERKFFMHERSIMQSILDIVMEKATRHGLKKVKEINIVIGVLSGVEPEALSL
ncbi:hydrogenase nickel incorporation protein HypA [Moorella thermoacetica]|nr:hydrogenase nickel incorporation protein HypA [Moorella thermoacetica]